MKNPQTETLTIADVEVTVKFNFTPGYPDTRDDPGMDDEFEILEVYSADDISALISPVDMDTLYTQLYENRRDFLTYGEEP